MSCTIKPKSLSNQELNKKVDVAKYATSTLYQSIEHQSGEAGDS